MSNESAGELSLRHEAFCREFIRTGNASESARRAGYSSRSAAEQGHRLLRNDNVRRRLQDLREEWQAERHALLCSYVQPAVECLGSIVAGTAPAKGAVSRVSAAVAILDRAGFKPLDRAEVKTAASITVALSRDDMSL